MASFRFLVTTNNLLGLNEVYPETRYSHDAFAEILKIARDKDVDFILLGGNLLQQTIPDPDMKKICYDVIKAHMDAEVLRGTTFYRTEGNFSQPNRPNFESNSITVPYPIMTIHGTFDNSFQLAKNSTSFYQDLANDGLLNYFGQIKAGASMYIEPIILQKADIKIALYGFGHIKAGKKRKNKLLAGIKFKLPPEDAFSVFIFHQPKLNSNLASLPNFFHLIINGYEGFSNSPQPIPNSRVGGFVYQPGPTDVKWQPSQLYVPKQVAIFSVSRNPASYLDMSYEVIEPVNCRWEANLLVQNRPYDAAALGVKNLEAKLLRIERTLGNKLKKKMQKEKKKGGFSRDKRAPWYQGLTKVEKN